MAQSLSEISGRDSQPDPDAEPTYANKSDSESELSDPEDIAQRIQGFKYTNHATKMEQDLAAACPELLAACPALFSSSVFSGHLNLLATTSKPGMTDYHDFLLFAAQHTRAEIVDQCRKEHRDHITSPKKVGQLMDQALEYVATSRGVDAVVTRVEFELAQRQHGVVKRQFDWSRAKDAEIWEMRELGMRAEDKLLADGEGGKMIGEVRVKVSKEEVNYSPAGWRSFE